MAFFGGKTIAEAFTAANTKVEIETWFQDFADHPGNFGIVVEHQQSMINAVAAIQAFRGIARPLPHFNDPNVPILQRVDAPKIHYRGNAVMILTIFDVVGWILSVVGVAPGDPDVNDNKAEYYYPLLTLYATICRTLLKLKVPRLDVEANMMQVTWFEEGGVWRVALGANLDAPPHKLKASAKNSRGERMLYAGVITLDQYMKVNFDWLSPSNTYEYTGRGLAFGHCAETLPFTFVQWLRTSIRTASIGGLATVPGVLLGSLDAVVYDVDMRGKFGPTISGTVTAMQVPCKNCSMIVVSQFGVGLDRFQIPQ